jgi:hypothetical protein
MRQGLRVRRARAPAWGGCVPKRSVMATAALIGLVAGHETIVPEPLEGQGRQGAVAAAPTPATYKAPRTPWGEPDFQGIWTTNEMHGVPNTRAAGSPAVISEADALARRQKTTAATVGAEGIGNYDEAFRDTSAKFTRQRISRQGSIIVDPPDGQMPPRRTAPGEPARAASVPAGGPAGPEALGGWERCITRGAKTIVEPSGYNNGVQFVQSPGVVAIQKEMIHETRIISINAGPHVSSKIRTWAGDARGRWEGDTLVVEIRNFDGRAGLSGAGRDATLTERYTRLGPNELEYLFTVDDPGVWERPWTGRMTMSLDPGQYELVEYACHEANYSMINTLSAVRRQEAAGREAPSRK